MLLHASTHTGFGPFVVSQRQRPLGWWYWQSSSLWHKFAQLGGGDGGTGGPLVQLLPGIGYGPTSGSQESQPGFPRCAGLEAEHQLQ